MAETDAYRSTLDRLQRDLVQAESHANRLRAAITAIRGILEADAPSTRPASETMGSAHGVERDSRLATATMLDAAIIAFERKGKAMRVRELYELLMAMGYPYTKGFETFKGSMTPTLDRRAEFSKVSPGLYQLSAWTRSGQGLPATMGTVIRETVS